MLWNMSRQLAWLLTVSHAITVFAAPSSRNIEHGPIARRRIFPRSYDLKCQRSDDDLDLLKTEFENAAKMADFASKNLASDGAKPYLQGFVAKSLLDIPNNAIINQLQEAYGRGAGMADKDDFKYTVTCDDTKDMCKKGYYASMNDASKTMNFCSAWWDVAGTPADGKAPNLQSTVDILANCQGDSPRFNNLQDFWVSRAESLLHEWTHTTYYTGSERTYDYAYAVQLCLDLAAGSRDTSKLPRNRAYNKAGQPYCPDKDDATKAGVCDPALSIDNADSLALIASGTWFSDKGQCNRQIPIGLTANPPDTPDSDPGTPIDPPGEDTGDPDTTCDTGNAKRDGSDPCATSTPASTPTPPSPPPPPPYATGTCSFHLTETENCDPDYGHNLWGVVKMYDNDKNVIGETAVDDDNPIGQPMDAAHSYSFTSKLPQPLVITGEHENDYVQFTYGGLSWQSKSPNGGGSCTVGGWDPRDGPICNDFLGANTNAVNNMDCSFPC